jgi:hypothetical protein
MMAIGRVDLDQAFSSEFSIFAFVSASQSYVGEVN